LSAGIACADSARDILDATGVEGGLIVHLGCGDGKLTAALRATDSYLVHGLDPDARNVEKAREYIRSLGLYGPVSVDQLRGDRLPYAGNLVSLLLAENLGEIPMREVRRVLTPHGVAYTKIGGEWTRNAKPRPDDIDEWTHWLHGADGNAVARDRVVGPPRRIQWAADPLWSRHHDTVPSTSAMVSSDGRLFYISDEAPIALTGEMPDKWFLVARDAFSGVLLWKRPIAEWGWNQWNAKWLGRFNAPPQLAKRLVAIGNRVYVTLGFNAPLTALDASTGKVLLTYEDTRGTDEILYHNGVLILSVNQEARTPSVDDRVPVRKTVRAIDAESGRALWIEGDYIGLRAKQNSSEPFGRLELAAGEDQVFLADHDALLSLDLTSGKERWRVARPAFEDDPIMYGVRMSDQCVLVYQDGIVLFAQPEMQKDRSWHTLPGTLHAFRASDGRELWTHQYGGWAHNWQPDVFVIDGLVWLHEHQDVEFEGHDPPNKDEIDYAAIGLDLETGKLERRFSTSDAFNVRHHHRCYRGKATERFLLPSRRGIEFLDLATEDNHLNHWARGGCLHGIVPCNGLIYLTPHPCKCYIETQLNGFYALAPEGPASTGEASGAFERGPAYGASREPGSSPQNPDDWPTFRHDASRSGATDGSLPARLKPGWRSAVGGRLSPPVAANGTVLVTSIDEHRVVALDADDGDELWSFVAGGRVDTPPTSYRGLVLFGSADGWVYCLREADGKLVWRRRVAPRDRLVGAYGQLESAWPVRGSILVQDGIAYLAAGRSSYLDGGIVLYALDPATGGILREQVLHDPDPAAGIPDGESRSIPGVLADILVGDGESIYMRQAEVFADRPDPKAHLVATAGLRDDSWFNRMEWAIGAVGSSQLLVFDDRMAYGVAPYSRKQSKKGFIDPGGQGYLLFADEWKRDASSRRSDEGPGWEIRVPVRVTSMALAGQTLIIAGPPDVLDLQDPLGAFEGRKGGRVWTLSPSDGSKLAEYELDSPPVFDGMAVAHGKLYISLESGELVCFGG